LAHKHKAAGFQYRTKQCMTATASIIGVTDVEEGDRISSD